MGSYYKRRAFRDRIERRRFAIYCRTKYIIYLVLGEVYGQEEFDKDMDGFPCDEDDYLYSIRTRNQSSHYTPDGDFHGFNCTMINPKRLKSYNIRVEID